MYQDENNQYHYSYRDSQQPGESFNNQPAGEPASLRQIQEMKPVKKKQTGWKLAALALSCALLGGAVGGGVAWGIGTGAFGGKSAHVQMSSRPVTKVELVSVDGKTMLTDAELYAANVNSAVSINVTGTAGTNFFGQPVKTASAGSGFVLTADGFIVTNYHVVENAETVKVTLYNGDEYEAKYVGGDEDYDIAVVKVGATGLQPVVLGDSTGLNVGDHVLAIGNPLGELTFSMSGGMVSSVNRAIHVGETPFNMIQTDASINSGNSGGPLFNQYGEVVGIVSAKYSSSGSGASVEGLGFAIPINDVIAMIQDIMTNGYITNKPYLGISPMSLTPEMAAQYRFTINSGVFICSTEEGSAAEKAGLRLGDVITAVDETKVNTVEDLNAAKKRYSAGDTATLSVYREGETIEIEIIWDAVPEDQQTVQRTEPQSGGQSGSQYGDQYGNGYYYSNPFDIFNYFFR